MSNIANIIVNPWFNIRGLA